MAPDAMMMYIRSVAALGTFGTVPPVSPRLGLVLWWDRCDRCCGRGMYSTSSLYLNREMAMKYDSRYATTKTTNCPKCNATGYLPAIFGEHERDWVTDV